MSGKVLRARVNGTFDISYDNGEREMGVKRAMIRLEGAGARSEDDDDDRRSSSSAAAAKLRMGDKVMACCKGSKKQYPGTIFKDNRDGTYDVKFDDGDRDRAVPERGISKEGGSKPASKSSFGGRSDDDDDRSSAAAKL